MGIAEARERMAKLAGGHFCSLRYSEEVNDGKVTVTRDVYYDGGREIFDGKTWEEALGKMEDAITDPNRS